MSDLRLTRQTLKVLAEMLADPSHPRYGLDLAKNAGVRTSTIYDTLMRLERHGWARSVWEALPRDDAGRPRRRLYQLTGIGEQRARQALEIETAQLSSPLTGAKNRKPVLGSPPRPVTSR